MRKKLQRSAPEATPSAEEDLAVSANPPHNGAVAGLGFGGALAPDMMGDEGDEENSDLPTMRRSDARRELATVEKIQTAPGNPYQQAAEEPSRGLRDARAAGKYATTEILAMNSKPITAPIRVADDHDQLGEYVD